MTDAGVLEVVELDELLDFDPTCESRHGCDRTATWAFVYLCCERAEFFCDEHRAAFVRWLDEQERTRQVIRHRPCGTKGFGFRWKPLRGGLG